MQPLKMADVFGAVSDDSSLELFKLIASSNGATSDVLRSKMTLTRKQYYSRLYRLSKCGLIKRRENSYVLTAFGKVLSDALTTVETALDNFWRIKVADTLDAEDGVPADEQKKLLESLISDQEIKSILLKRDSVAAV
jgi:hypothetical protein